MKSAYLSRPVEIDVVSEGDPGYLPGRHERGDPRAPTPTRYRATFVVEFEGPSTKEELDAAARRLCGQ